MHANPLELSLLYLRLTGASRSESLLISCSVLASSSLSEGFAAPGLHWEHVSMKQEHTGAIAGSADLPPQIKHVGMKHEQSIVATRLEP